jgi:hypothetical protein
MGYLPGAWMAPNAYLDEVDSSTPDAEREMHRRPGYSVVDLSA